MNDNRNLYERRLFIYTLSSLRLLLGRIEAIESIEMTTTETFSGILYYIAEVYYRGMLMGVQLSHGKLTSPAEVETLLAIRYQKELAKKPFDAFILNNLNVEVLDDDK